jgi:hypothetical protein
MKIEGLFTRSPRACCRGEISCRVLILKSLSRLSQNSKKAQLCFQNHIASADWKGDLERCCCFNFIDAVVVIMAWHNGSSRLSWGFPESLKPHFQGLIRDATTLVTLLR